MFVLAGSRRSRPHRPSRSEGEGRPISCRGLRRASRTALPPGLIDATCTCKSVASGRSDAQCEPIQAVIPDVRDAARGNTDPWPTSRSGRWSEGEVAPQTTRQEELEQSTMLRIAEAWMRDGGLHSHQPAKPAAASLVMSNEPDSTRRDLNELDLQHGHCLCRPSLISPTPPEWENSDRNNVAPLGRRARRDRLGRRDLARWTGAA